jgi:hypothetical protein
MVVFIALFDEGRRRFVMGIWILFITNYDLWAFVRVDTLATLTSAVNIFNSLTNLWRMSANEWRAQRWRSSGRLEVRHLFYSLVRIKFMHTALDLRTHITCIHSIIINNKSLSYRTAFNICNRKRPSETGRSIAFRFHNCWRNSMICKSVQEQTTALMLQSTKRNTTINPSLSEEVKARS